jgi:hypothetical protein
MDELSRFGFTPPCDCQFPPSCPGCRSLTNTISPLTGLIPPRRCKPTPGKTTSVLPALPLQRSFATTVSNACPSSEHGCHRPPSRSPTDQFLPRLPPQTLVSATHTRHMVRPPSLLPPGLFPVQLAPRSPMSTREQLRFLFATSTASSIAPTNHTLGAQPIFRTWPLLPSSTTLLHPPTSAGHQLRS